MRHLWPQVLSKLILLLYQQKWQLLYRQKWQPESPPSKPRRKTSTGRSGYDSATTCESIQDCSASASATQSHSSWSSCGDSKIENLPPAVSPSQLAMLRKPPTQWGRQWLAWGPAITKRIQERGKTRFLVGLAASRLPEDRYT
jgi:hypothetical protein